MNSNIANTEVNTHVIRPNYDRKALKSRIVHLGFGAFHRAHQALFTNEMLEKTDSDWGICEINLFGGEDLNNKGRWDEIGRLAREAVDLVKLTHT